MMDLAQALRDTPRPVTPRTPPFTIAGLRRPAVWGAAAVGALLIAVVSSGGETGTRRLADMFQDSPAQAAAQKFDAEAETHRLFEALRDLSIDEFHLKSRVAVIEQGVDEVTGSISKQIEAVAAAQHSQEGPSVVATAAATASMIPVMTPPAPAKKAAPEALVPVVTPANPPPPSPAPTAANAASADAMVPAPPTAPPPAKPAPAAMPAAAMPTPAPMPALADSSFDTPAPARTTVYGVDIGSGLTIQALRARWASIRTAHSQLFAGLSPIVTVKEVPKANRIELRLVAGPLPQAAAASDLCLSLTAFGLFCQPTIYDGQRLALR